MSKDDKKKEEWMLELKQNIENWINSDKDDPIMLREAILKLLKEYAKDFLGKR